MPSANDSVWLSVLPDMSGFGKAVTNSAGPEADKAGDTLGNRMSGKMKIALVAGGAAIGAALVKGIGDNINIGKVNDKLAAQLGLTGKDAAKAGQVAGNLYRNAYGDSIEGVSDAVGAVMSSIKGMSDASAGDLEKVTAKALDFATAFDVDVNRAAQVVGQTMKYGLAGDATEAFDLITAASQKVPAALREDLLDAVDEYGPSFQQIGLSGKDAFALLVEGSEQGTYGIDKAGDAIKEFTIRATDLGDKGAQDALKSIGLSGQDMANDILAGGETAKGATTEIINGLLGIKDPSEQAAAAVALFGTPLEDLGKGQIPGFLKSLSGASTTMDDAAGASKRMGDTLNDNFATRMEGWKRQAAGFAQDAVMKIAGAIGKVVDVGRTMKTVFDNNKTTITVVAGIITTLMVPALIAWGVQSAISGAKSVAAWLATKIGAMQSAALQVISLTLITTAWISAGIQAALGAAKQVAAWLLTKVQAGLSMVAQGLAFAAVVAGWVLMGAQSLLGAAKIAAAWLIAMGPIGLIIAAVVGLAIIIVKNWDTIKAGISAAWTWIKINVFAPIGTFFTTTIPGWVSSGVAKIKSAWDGLMGILNSVWSWVKTNVLNPIGTFFKETIPGWVSSGVGKIKSAWDGLMAIIKAPFTWIKENVFSPLSELVKTKIPSAFSSGVTAIGKAWDGIKSIAKKPVNFVIDTVYNNGLRAGFNTVASALKLESRLPKMNSIGGKGNSLPRRPMRASGGAGGSGSHSHGNGMGGIGDVLGNVKDAAGAGLGKVKDAAGFLAGKGWDFAKGQIMKPINAIIGRVGSGPIPELAKGAFNKGKDGVLGWLKDKFMGSDLDSGATAGGPLGKAGRVLPAGRYSIGMPYRGYPGHNGADYPAAIGTPVYAPWAGQVTGSYDIPGSGSGGYASYGRVVQIGYGNGHSSLFAHLNARNVSRGDNVKAGQQVGTVGTNGNSTGPHLHAEFDGGSVNPASLGIFDQGGWLNPGAAAMNMSSKPEPVFSSSQWSTLKGNVGSSGVDSGAIAAAVAAAINGASIGITDNGVMANDFAGRLNTRSDRMVAR